MRRDDVAVFLRCVDFLGMTFSVGLVYLGYNAAGVVLLFLSTSFALACMVADGLIGDWREQRDRAERMKAAEDAQRMGRQFRRMTDLWEFERRRSNV